MQVGRRRGTFLIPIEHKAEAVSLATKTNTGLDDETQFSAGVEYCFTEMLSLRAGYRTGLAGVGSGLRAGVGFLWKTYGLNYAFEPYRDLGNTHRFPLLIRL